MTRKLLQQMKCAAQADHDDWLTGVSAIVEENEDPEHEHRIKVIIPLMDEEKVYDKWVRSLSALVLGPGFGSFFVPPKGAEVVIFGQLGQKHNLFYIGGIYNEKFKTPPDFEDSATSGFRVPGDFKIIAEGDLQLRGGGIHIESDGDIHITTSAAVFINGRQVT
jgi:hypothetical protein